MELVQAVLPCLSVFYLAVGIVGQPKRACPANYIPLNRKICVLFVSDAGSQTSFKLANAACLADGGNLLQLNTGTFDQIRQLADMNQGNPPCDFWVGAKEESTDGVWYDLYGDSLPATSFFNPMTNSVGDGAHHCGKLSASDGFYLRDGGNCTFDSNGYICQTNP